MIKLKMEKDTMKHTALDNCEDCSPGGRAGMMRERGNIYCLGSFWGQLILMGILTLLFWLCLFSVAGYFPSKGYASSPFDCNPLPPVPQSENLLQNQDQQDPTPTNFMFFGYIITSILGEDDASSSNTNTLEVVESQDSLMAPSAPIDPIEFPSDPISFSVLQTAMSGDKENDTDDFELILPDVSKSDKNISQLFDLITEALTDESTELELKYFISPEDQKLNWFEALQACVLNDMQLVAIETAEKNTEIIQMIEDEIGLGAENEFWTAGTNLWTYSRNKYYWASTGTPVEYTYWHMNNPNDPVNQNCIQLTTTLDSSIQTTLRWNDYACYAKSRFICESFSD